MPDIKKWNGSAWVDAENKRWDGSNWVDAYTYKWDGSNWIQIYPATFTNKTVTLNLTQNMKVNASTGAVEYQEYGGKYYTTVDMIEVKPGLEYLVYSDVVTHITVYEYGTNGTYLKLWQDIVTQGPNYYSAPFTPSANTHFVRIFMVTEPGTSFTLTGMLK